MDLFFCPRCRQPFPGVQQCPICNLTADAEKETFAEKLLETVINAESDRAGIAVDVLTKWMRAPRTVAPLVMLLDPNFQVIGARGLGWLQAKQAVSELVKPLLAEALGKIGEEAVQMLEQARTSPRHNMAEAAARALKNFIRIAQDNQL